MADNRPEQPESPPPPTTIASVAPVGGTPTPMTQAALRGAAPQASQTSPPSRPSVSVPNKSASDQIIERCIALASWGHNITSNGRECKTTKERRAQMTRYTHLISHVSHDANVITPHESIVESSPTDMAALSDDDFVGSDAYKACTAVPRTFTPSIRGAGEICDAIAHAQYNSFHLYNARKMAPAFLAGCSPGIAFGSKREKKLALRLCFADSSRVDNLIKDFESLRNNAFEGFVRALHEKSPINAAMAAWVCGKASADMILLRKSKLKHGPLRKFTASGLFTNDGTAASYAAPSDYVSEISKRSKNTDMTFDTATRVFDSAIKRVLEDFITKATNGKTKTTKADLGIYLRQTRTGTEESVDGAELGGLACPGILTPRNPDFLRKEQEKRSNKPDYTRAALMFDKEINVISKRRKRKAAEDLDRSTAADIIGSSPATNDGLTNQTEWSMHITQLVAEAFLETMSSLLACSFGVADPLSEKGMSTIKNRLLKSIGDLNSKRVEENAASAAIEYFVKIGNFSIPFVASDPNDIVEGRRVSPNTPVIFIVNKTTDPNDASKVSTVLSLRDRLLVKDDLMKKALATKDDNAATSKTPTVGGSLPVIRRPFPVSTGASTAAREAKEGISIDWYVNLSNMCSTGKTSAAVASGLSRALASASNMPPKRPEERKMLESLRRNVDRSKNLLYAMGQNLSSWGYEEHNASINSYWSSISAARSFATQEAMNRGNDIGVRYQFDKSCVRDSFVDAEAHMRVSFFDAVDRPGDAILHLGDIIASLSSNAPDASWKRFVDAMDTIPSAARRVFNIKELLNAASGFKAAYGVTSRRRKDVLKNVGAAVKLIKGLVEMSLQNAFNVASLEEAGSVADGWAYNNQFEPSRMKAIEDLSGARNRRDVVTVLLNPERGSVQFADRRRRGNNYKRTDVLVIPLVILEHLVADKVVLDSVVSASNRSLANVLENFIDILSGKDTKLFNDRNKFLTLVRYIWFNMAILSLTDSNIISAINMARRDLGDSIYSDYLAIRSLVNQYGDGASKYSIGKIIESYSGDGKKSSHTASKITTDEALNSVLKKLTAATEAISGDREADGKGVKAIPNEDAIKNITVNVNAADVIGADGQKKLSGFLRMVKRALETSIDLNLVLRHISIASAVPDQTQGIIRNLSAEGPAKNKPLDEEKTIVIDLNPTLKDPVMKEMRRLKARLGEEPEANASYIQSLDSDLAELTKNSCKRLQTTYFIPKGVTPKAAANVIAALNENYPHSNLLLKALEELPDDFVSAAPGPTITVKMSAMKSLLKNGLIVSLACLTNPRAPDFNSCGADLLAKILAHFSAEASLALSRLQNTFSPIHPGLLALHDTINPSKDEFDIMTEDFIKSVIEKIEEDSAPFLGKYDDGRMAKGLADAGVHYNDAVGSSSSGVLTEHLRNPTDLWNKYALAHFDTAIVPKFADTSRLSNTDLVKLSAYWQGMSKLPDKTEPSKWQESLLGTSATFSPMPGMGNICTFNSALDALLANPENSCGLISREITRNSAQLAHDVGSAESAELAARIFKTGHTIVLPKSPDTSKSNDQQHFDVFKYSAAESFGAATSSLGIISERFSDSQTPANFPNNDLVNTTIRSLPRFRQNIVDATRSLFEAAAICNLLTTEPKAKIASKTIINTIKTRSNVTGEIGISRIAGLVSSVTTYKQYRNFLAFVDEKRRTLMRRAALNCSSSCGLNAADNMYISLAPINPSYPEKMEHLPDRFWVEVFEDCEGFAEEDITPKVFTSKLNSYAAVASKANRTSEQKLKAESAARRQQVASKMVKLEKFVIAAAKIDLINDQDVALSNLMRAQRLLARMNTAIEARKNDSIVFLSNRGQIPTVTNVIDGVFSEMVTGPEGKDGGSLFLASKMMVAKEIAKQSPGQETVEMSLAAAGVDSHAYRLAEIICQRMNADDISLFMGGSMLQRGLFTTFLLNDILARQISPDLMTNALSEETKKQMVNLVEFSTKIKQALVTMRKDKDRSIKRYTNAMKRNKTVTDDMRADWAFAASVYSAFKTLRDNTSFASRASNLIDMLGEGARGGTPAVALRPLRKSSLNDVLEAGTTLNRSFFSNYCEKTAASKVVRTSNIRMYRALRKRNNQNPGLLACFDSGKLFSDSVEEGIHASSRFCQDEDYDMLLDEYDEDMPGLSSESSSESEGGMSDWSDSEDSDNDDDDASGRKRDALAALDSLAVPLGKLYACGEGYNDDDVNSAFDTNLGRLVGRVDSDDEGESDESDEDDLTKTRGSSRAHRIVYGAGFLASGPSTIYDNPYRLSEFISGKKAKYDMTSSSDSSNGGDNSQMPTVERLKRRSKADQMSFMKRGLRQFVPKDITIDENDKITTVKYMAQDTASGFLTSYGASGHEDRKRLRDDNDIQSAAPAKSSRAQRISFRRNLVKGAATVVQTLKNNGDIIYSALFAKPDAAAINTSNVANELLFAENLQSIVTERNDFIKEAAAAASALFSCENNDNDTGSIPDDGYLTAPMTKLARCLRRSAVDTGPMTIGQMTDIKTKSHLDWLNTVSTVFARSFNVSTGYALDEVFKVTKVLDSLYDSFGTIINSAEGAKEDVRSSLLSDIFNTRMVHTNAIMGLFLPTAFLNYQIKGKTQLESNEIEMELLTLVRGINSRQLSTDDLGGSTDILLNRLMAPRFSGPAGSRGGLSLFRMSLTDTIMGKGRPIEGGRVKGAVSLEVRPGGPEGGMAIEDHIFAKKCKHLVEFCKEQNILIGHASGPLYRFATGVDDIKAALSLHFTPNEEVADDNLANRLIANETDEKRGDFMRLSAHGNLYGCFDIIARLARKTIEMQEVVKNMLDKDMSAKETKDRAKAVLEELRNKRVKALKTPFPKRSIILENNAFPSFSDNVLYKSREFLASVATLTQEVTKRLSLEFNKLSLKSFERILENSAVLANTKSTLRNLENRLQAAVVELGQFKHIRDNGLTTPRRVIDTTAKRLCTLTPDKEESWLLNDAFIKFAVDSELFNLKEAKMNISRALKGVHVQHVSLLNMINTAISTDDSGSGGGVTSPRTEKRNQMKLSACGSYVIHPSTGLLVKIEEGDITGSCGDGIESVHRQVALKVLERIDSNRNVLLRNKLYAMRTGRGDLRAILSLDNEDIVKTDSLVKALGTALANSASTTDSITPQQYQEQQQSVINNAFNGSVLPIRKAMSYIPVALENKHSPSPSCADTGSAPSTAVSLLSDGNQETTYRFMDQQEAHDLTSILNIRSKHMGDYNQASLVALFNRSHTTRADIPFGDEKASASPSKQLFENINQATAALAVPPSSTNKGTGNSNGKRVSDYVSKIASSLSDTPEYSEMTKIHDDMTNALSVSSSISLDQFITNPPQEGHYPKTNYDTIEILSAMIQLKTTAIERYVKMLSSLSGYSNDPSMASSVRPSSSPIISTIESGAIDSSVVRKIPPGTDSSLTATVDMMGRIEAAFQGGNPREVIDRETDIRRTLLMHYDPFLKKIQHTLSMISDYFANIEKIREDVKEAVKRISADQIKKVEKSLKASEKDAVPVYERGVDMHKEEVNAINTEVSVLKTKIVEIESTHDEYVAALESLTNKFSTGTNEVPVDDLISVSESSQRQARMIEDLSDFAKKHTGVVYDPEAEEASDTENMKTIKDDIARGQNGVCVTYSNVLSKFPGNIKDEMKSVEDIKIFMSNLRLVTSALEDYIFVLRSRIGLLEDRASTSSADAASIEERINSSKALLQNQLVEQRAAIEKHIRLSASVINHSLAGEVVQVETLNFIDIQVERLLTNAKRGNTPATVNEPVAPGEEGSSIVNTTSSAETVDRLAADIEGNNFACQLKPLHDVIDRMMDMYRRKGTSIVSSKADLQLATVFDMSMAVLGKNSHPEQKPSGIVPGLCRLCAMMITNLHEETHTSDHAFEFDTLRSAETLRRMLSAVISKDSDKANVRYDTLSMMESHNGYVKNLKFKKKQRVACLTPINTLLGAYDNMTIQPGTILLPSSELFACDGLDHDKFRSMVHRSSDPSLADSSKSADSIVEMYASSDPNAEMLFFTHKDERRFFNSIPDCIIENMSDSASSVYNTYCSQNAVREDPKSGIPVFVGRLNRPAPAATAKPTKSASGNGGVPTHCTGTVNMGARYMVAPGATLNAKKEEMMRLSRISDVNNVLYYGLDVNVSGSNNAWRIGEIVKAACGGNDMLMEKARKMLLLGSVTTLAQQKASSRVNDPTTLLQTNSVVEQYVAGETVSAEDIIVKMSYQQRFFPEMCNHASRFVGSTAAVNSGIICPGDLLGDYKRFKSALNRHENSCGVFLNSLSGVPTSSTPQGILDTVVQSQPIREKNTLAVRAMTDSTVDMVSAVSSGAWKNANLFMPNTAIVGKPITRERAEELKRALVGVLGNANKLDRMGGSGGIASLSAVFGGGRGNTGFASTASVFTEGNSEFERLFNMILGNAASSSPSSFNTREDIANHRSLVSSVLDISDKEMTDMVRSIEESIDKTRLEKAISEIKRNVLITSSSFSSPISSSRASSALSAVLKASDIRQGRLSSSVMESGEEAIRAVDSFKTSPLLVRHTALFHPFSPLTLSSQTRDMLARRTKSTTTANNLLSESMPILSDLILCNTRDAPVERAIDRMLLAAYITKQAKHFDDVCSSVPVALTSITHNMLSAIDHKSSRLIANLKLHVNDTTSILLNIERFEKLFGRYGDEYAMSNRQNCNCPFELHHDFRPSADESLVRSFAYARPEVSIDEIRDTPYLCHRALSNKHFIMDATKVDPRVSGAALYRKVSAWADMHNNVSYTGTFEPSRMALANSNFSTAGVNLDVIVRPNNASGVLGVLRCHRKHLCVTDLKVSVASSMPSVFNSEENASELIQNALPHNKYIQKSRLNASNIIFANILDKLIKDLGMDISKGLSHKLLNGEYSVSETVLEETNTIMDKLLSSASVSGFKMSSSSKEAYSDEAEDITDATVLTGDIALNYARAALKEAVSEELRGSAENVPFSSAADGSMAFDFLMSKDSGTGAVGSVGDTASSDKSLIAVLFEAVASKIGDKDFGRILDGIDAKIRDFNTTDTLNNMSSEAKDKWLKGRQELRRLVSFLRILRDNITPSLTTGQLGEDVKLYISLISAKSRLENVFRYGLSNSSSVDLSHLKPLNPTAVSKNIEDTFTYRNVPPIFVMALPDNFSALFQQEQRDPEYIIDNRRSITSFLNHPNTKSMANAARASVGPGGGSSMGIYPSALLLQESSVVTAEPVVDATTSPPTMYETSVTKNPLMIVDPFKPSACLEGLPASAADIINTNNPCSYLQVSMPTQFSGLVTNTGVTPSEGSTTAFEFKRRDGSVVNYRKLTPAVLCSDASFNLMDEFSRADTTLNDMEIRFGFMPEILEAVAKFKGLEVSDVVKSMNAKTTSNGNNGGNTTVDRATGDVVTVKNGVAFPTHAVQSAATTPNEWGVNGVMQGRSLPSFLINNPSGAASVNGVPVTREGELLAALKRGRAAGKGDVNEDEFGKGVLSEGALRAVGDKTLSSDLKPLKEAWDRLVKLQKVFTTAANNLRESVESNVFKDAEVAKNLAQSIVNNFKILKECKNFIRDMTSRIVASSDLVTGGYGGDPSLALVAPYRSENMGIIGAISGGANTGIGGLMASKSRGIEALRTVMEEQVTLSSKRGREMPEHSGIRYDDGEELVSDADSLFRGVVDKSPSSSSLLHKVVENLVHGLETGDRLRQRAFEDVKPSMDSEETKRHAITKLLSENHDLLAAVANTMYFGSDQDGSRPTTKRVVDIIDETKYQQRVKYDAANKDGLNALFNTR